MALMPLQDAPAARCRIAPGPEAKTTAPRKTSSMHAHPPPLSRFPHNISTRATLLYTNLSACPNSGPGQTNPRPSPLRPPTLRSEHWQLWVGEDATESHFGVHCTGGFHIAWEPSPVRCAKLAIPPICLLDDTDLSTCVSVHSIRAETESATNAIRGPTLPSAVRRTICSRCTHFQIYRQLNCHHDFGGAKPPQ